MKNSADTVSAVPVRRFLSGPAGLAGIFAICLLSANFACSQSYPNRPIRVILTGSAGGAPNVIARIVGVQLERQLGQPIVVESRAGASGIIAAEAVAKAPPDGYMLLHATPAFVILPNLHKVLPYDIFRDFAPVTNLVLGTGYLVLLHPSVKAASMKELMALARSKPDSLAYGSPGVGNSLHLATESLNLEAGIKMLHVPYKGAAPSITALIAGEIQMLVSPPAAIVQHVKGGKLRAIGYTGNARWSEMPEVPAIAESLPGFSITGAWHGWFAPAATPREIVARLNAEVARALQVATVRDGILAAGYEPDGRSTDEFQKFVRADARRYADAVRAAKIAPE